MMNRKKVLSVFVLSIILVSFMLEYVSSAPTEEIINGVQEGGKAVYELFRPLLEGIVGETESGETFLARVLFLFIIFAIILSVLGKVDFFSEKPWVLWVVSIAVSILSIRWFGEADIVQAAILPYSVLGVAVSAGLPFVLYFFIVEGFKERTMRKIAWIFFAVIYIGLWISRYGDTNFIGPPAPGTTLATLGGFSFIYFITAVLAFLMLIYDGTIQRIRKRIKQEKKLSDADLKRKHKVMDKIDEDKDLLISMRERGVANADIQVVRRRIDALEDELSRLSA